MLPHCKALAGTREASAGRCCRIERGQALCSWEDQTAPAVSDPDTCNFSFVCTTPTTESAHWQCCGLQARLLLRPSLLHSPAPGPTSTKVAHQSRHKLLYFSAAFVVRPLHPGD